MIQNLNCFNIFGSRAYGNFFFFCEIEWNWVKLSENESLLVSKTVFLSSVFLYQTKKVKFEIEWKWIFGGLGNNFSKQRILVPIQDLRKCQYISLETLKPTLYEQLH